MNKKKLPHIIAVFAIAVFVVFVSACQTTEQKEAEKRRDDLINNGGLAMFTQMPSAGETVIKEYKESAYQTNRSGNLNVYQWQPYRYYDNSSAHTNLHPANMFSPEQAAYVLLAKARKEFPNIDINEMDVRSIVKTDVRFWMSIANKPDKDGYYSFSATNYFYFDGVVVRVKK